MIQVMYIYEVEMCMFSWSCDSISIL